MANFNLSVKYVLENEGGYVDGTKIGDAGGPTNMGITLSTLTAFRKQGVSADDIQRLSKDEAMQIYYEFYYRPLRLMFINNNNIATCLLDMGVNLGIHAVTILAQKTLVRLLLDTGVDGKIDDITIDSINQAKTDEFIDAFETFVMNHYNQIVNKNPRDAKFLHGWSRRAGRLLTLK